MTSTPADRTRAVRSPLDRSHTELPHHELSHHELSHDDLSHDDLSHDDLSHEDLSHHELLHHELSHDELSQDKRSPASASHSPQRPIAVYGAGGHTGRFIVAELRRRGLATIAIGRRRQQLPDHLPAREARVDDPAALRRALAGCSVVINAAGPFLDTATPVIEAALASGCSYVDVTAEQASADSSLMHFDAAARAAGVIVLPAAGFFGGLADLLVTALHPTAPVRSITTAVALDRWWPTPGTRRTGERNRAPRWVIEHGHRQPLTSPPADATWHFDAPHGRQAMIELPFSEIVTLSHHHGAAAIRSWFGRAALDDLRDPATPPPTAAGADGRSAQHFALEVVLTDAAGERRARATGRDIYAVSAPLVVEAAAGIATGSHRRNGALSLGAAFDAGKFLAALDPAQLNVRFDRP